MYLPSNSKDMDYNQTNTVFIPKKIQTKRTNQSFTTNNSSTRNEFREKCISMANGSALPTTNRRHHKIIPLNSISSQNRHTVPVEVHHHQQSQPLSNHKPHTSTRQTISEVNNKKSETMTAIKGILKSNANKTVGTARSDSASADAANGVIKNCQNINNHHSGDSQCIINVNSLSAPKTHNQRWIAGNSRPTTNNTITITTETPSPTRRKSSSVQFDIQSTKESARTSQFSAYPSLRGLTSLSAARRESSISSGSLSIIGGQQSSNAVLTYDLPKSSQRMSDLRKILNPEIEKEDSLKKLGDRLIHCECFELNLNNAAKIISALVLVATIILVLRALYYNVF